mgnify:FL=1
MKNNTPKRTKLIYGVGINDANYTVSATTNPLTSRCNFYTKWIGMLERCYSGSNHKKRPTYTGCTVTSEWLLFSNFRSWMVKQDWQGKQLDKDILIQNNKIYCPSTCIFVTSEINKLLNKYVNRRGVYPRGVSLYKNRYAAHCCAYGKLRHVGYYDTPEKAHQAYKEFKYKYIAEIANQQSEPLRTALLNYVIEG